MKRTYKPWTHAEENRLRELVAAGLSCAEISEAMGRTKSSIYNRAGQLKLYIQYPDGGHNGAGPSLPNEVIHVIRVLDESGISTCDILQLLRRQFRVSRRYLYYVLSGEHRANDVQRPPWR